jgi:DNA-binding protein HU-beta
MRQKYNCPKNDERFKVLKGRKSLMNKADIIKSMAEKSSLTRAEAESALNAFVDSVEEALVGGDKVQLVGFGSFEVRERAARKGRNPQTKQEINIEASKSPIFKVGKALKDMVNT